MITINTNYGEFGSFCTWELSLLFSQLVGLDAYLVVFFEHYGFVGLLGGGQRSDGRPSAHHPVLLEPGLVQGQTLAPGAVGCTHAGSGAGSDHRVRSVVVPLSDGGFLQGCRQMRCDTVSGTLRVRDVTHTQK